MWQHFIARIQRENVEIKASTDKDFCTHIRFWILFFLFTICLNCSFNFPHQFCFLSSHSLFFQVNRYFQWRRVQSEWESQSKNTLAFKMLVDLCFSSFFCVYWTLSSDEISLNCSQSNKCPYFFISFFFRFFWWLNWTQTEKSFHVYVKLKDENQIYARNRIELS